MACGVQLYNSEGELLYTIAPTSELTNQSLDQVINYILSDPDTSEDIKNILKDQNDQFINVSMLSTYSDNIVGNYSINTINILLNNINVNDPLIEDTSKYINKLLSKIDKPLDDNFILLSNLSLSYDGKKISGLVFPGNNRKFIVIGGSGELDVFKLSHELTHYVLDDNIKNPFLNTILKDIYKSITTFPGLQSLKTINGDLYNNIQIVKKSGLNETLAWMMSNGDLQQLVKDINPESWSELNIWIDNYVNGVTYNKSNNITFESDSSTGYANRTKINAQADATIAIATDFNTSGEKLTRRSVLDQGKEYIHIDISSIPDNFNEDTKISDTLINNIVDRLNKANVKTLNIAGNGIYTLGNKISQEQSDLLVYRVLKSIISHPDLKNKIESIRSGGQSGIDESGIKSAIKLKIPAIVYAPKGWKFRDINNKDISNEQKFKERFIDYENELYNSQVSLDVKENNVPIQQELFDDTPKLYSKEELDKMSNLEFEEYSNSLGFTPIEFYGENSSKKIISSRVLQGQYAEYTRSVVKINNVLYRDGEDFPFMLAPEFEFKDVSQINKKAYNQEDRVELAKNLIEVFEEASSQVDYNKFGISYGNSETVTDLKLLKSKPGTLISFPFLKYQRERGNKGRYVIDDKFEDKTRYYPLAYSFINNDGELILGIAHRYGKEKNKYNISHFPANLAINMREFYGIPKEGISDKSNEEKERISFIKSKFDKDFKEHSGLFTDKDLGKFVVLDASDNAIRINLGENIGTLPRILKSGDYVRFTINKGDEKVYIWSPVLNVYGDSIETIHSDNKTSIWNYKSISSMILDKSNHIEIIESLNQDSERKISDYTKNVYNQLDYTKYSWTIFKPTQESSEVYSKYVQESNDDIEAIENRRSLLNSVTINSAVEIEWNNKYIDKYGNEKNYKYYYPILDIVGDDIYYYNGNDIKSINIDDNKNKYNRISSISLYNSLDREIYNDFKNIKFELVDSFYKSGNFIADKNRSLGLNQNYQIEDIEGINGLELDKYLSKLKIGDFIKTKTIVDNKTYIKYFPVVDFDNSSKLPIVVYNIKGKIKRAQFKSDNITSIGYRLDNNINLGIEGHSEFVYLRNKRIRDFKDFRKRFIGTENEINELFANGRLKKNYVNVFKAKWDGSEWVYNDNLKEVEDNKPEQMYFVTRKNSNKYNSFITKDINKFIPVYYPNTISYDNLFDNITLGSVITTYFNGDSGRVYLTGMVEEINNKSIKLTSYNNTNDNQFSWFIFKESGNLNNIVNIHLKIDNQWKSRLSKLRPKNIRKSEDLHGQFMKSKDKKENVILLSEQLKNLYNVEIEFATTQEIVSEIEPLIGRTVSNSRAFIFNGKTYINTDRASMAEPLHELSHLIMTGLKAITPDVYNSLLNSIKSHPDYAFIASNYEEYNDLDKDEEVFITIMSEYFRGKIINRDSQLWYNSGLFKDLMNNIGNILNDSLELDNNLITFPKNQLMNMSLDQIMHEFGSSLLSGDFNPLTNDKYIVKKTNNINLLRNLENKEIYNKICI